MANHGKPEIVLQADISASFSGCGAGVALERLAERFTNLKSDDFSQVEDYAEAAPKLGIEGMKIRSYLGGCTVCLGKPSEVPADNLQCPRALDAMVQAATGMRPIEGGNKVIGLKRRRSE